MERLCSFLLESKFEIWQALLQKSLTGELVNGWRSDENMVRTNPHGKMLSSVTGPFVWPYEGLYATLVSMHLSSAIERLYPRHAAALLKHPVLKRDLGKCTADLAD